MSPLCVMATPRSSGLVPESTGEVAKIAQSAWHPGATKARQYIALHHMSLHHRLITGHHIA